MTAWGPDGIVTRPGEGIRIEMGEHWMEVLARSTQTDGQLGVFDFRHGPIEANPPHAHLGFAKALYVLEGYYDFRVGEVESLGRARHRRGRPAREPAHVHHERWPSPVRVQPGGQRGDVPRAGRRRPGRDTGAGRGHHEAVADDLPARRRCGAVAAGIVALRRGLDSDRDRALRRI